MTSVAVETSNNELSLDTHILIDKWVLWAHLPHNTDWSLKSYIKIQELSTVEDVIKITNAIPEKMVKNCMLFLMRKGINPTWEDPKNMDGGCFSFKVINKFVPNIWKSLFCAVSGETLMKDPKNNNFINGITISPKKNFCVIKVWMSTCEFHDPDILIDIKNLSKEGCLFKKHEPEF